jgi:hypothetical protein
MAITLEKQLQNFLLERWLDSDFGIPRTVRDFDGEAFVLPEAIDGLASSAARESQLLDDLRCHLSERQWSQAEAIARELHARRLGTPLPGPEVVLRFLDANAAELVRRVRDHGTEHLNEEDMRALRLLAAAGAGISSSSGAPQSRLLQELSFRFDHVHDMYSQEKIYREIRSGFLDR